MARSFYRPQPDNTVEDYAHRNRYYHEPSDIHYTMVRRGGEFFQRQYQIGFDGRQTNVVETKIDYVLGSGNHARAYLHRTAKNTLILLPLGWYTEKGGTWAMNPGYDRPDHQALRRNITYECMFCHNAYPEIPEARGPRATPVYGDVPEGIDCQRCHGPGGKHAALARSQASFEEIRAAIVNPARLDPERRMEVCMQCHLETTSSALPASIVRYDRGPFSFRPGEPLGDFMLHFDQAPGKGYDGKFEITGSVYRLRKSQCFQKSGGALACTTCHNPHKPLRGAEAAAHYTEVCLGCHAAALRPAIAAGRHTASNDCTGCHMPKRRTEDVVHAVMTDHYIQRRAPDGDLLAERREQRQTEATAYRGAVVLYYPAALPKPEDELYVAVAQVSDGSNLAEGIARLTAAIRRFRPAAAEFYLQLGDALCSAGKCQEALPVYEEALRHEPQSEPAMARLAACLVNVRQYPRAVEVLREALDLKPADAAAWIQAGLAQLGLGKISDAISAFEKAKTADPAMVEAYNLLGSILFESGEALRAEPVLREAIRVQPNFAPARNNLGNLLSETGRFEEARYQFEAALRYEENYAGAHYNYALALARVHRIEDAQIQLEAVLRVNPNSAAAHEFLGNLYLAGRQADRAIAQYREAVRIEPGFDRANLDLGKALAASGKAEEAYPYLEKAAQSRDGEIRGDARHAIEKLKPAR